MKRWIVRIVIGIPLLMLLGFLALWIAFVPPLGGQVVDAVTGDPIAGIPVSLEIQRFRGWTSYTDVYAEVLTDKSGRFSLPLFVGWSIMGIGDSWVGVNHTGGTTDGFPPSYMQILYRPLSAGGPASYFPITLSFGGHCDLAMHWETCVNVNRRSFQSIALVPVMTDIGGCAKIGDAAFRTRCRELTLYRSAFTYVRTFDDAVQSASLCDQIANRIISQLCRQQAASYIAELQGSKRARLPSVEPRLRMLFPQAIAGTQQAESECDPWDNFNGHLQCMARYGEGPTAGDPLIRVRFEEWVGRDEPPAKKLEELQGTPEYTDDRENTRTWIEKRKEGTIRRYRGKAYFGAEWVSGNRYLVITAAERTKLHDAFILHFLAQYPSTWQ